MRGCEVTPFLSAIQLHGHTKPATIDRPYRAVLRGDYFIMMQAWRSKV
jgi:hypothetical protein